MPTAHTIMDTYDARIATIRTTYADRREALLTDIDQTSARLSELRSGLAGLDALIQADVDAARSDVYDGLFAKIDPLGCPVPRQGAPRGPRQKPADPPPTTQASEPPGTAADAFFAAVADRAPAAELDALGWDDAAVLSDAQTRVVCKHQIVPDEVAGFVVGGVVVAHKTWTMLDDARVVE